jgi:broad specificity phosphatase PhoE
MIDFTTWNGNGNFYFLRHGKSEGNETQIIQGRLDLPLAPLGREQARQIARWFKSKQLHGILTSPLARARETAQIVASELELPEADVADHLNELDTGLFTGLTVPQITEKYPRQWRAFQADSWEAVPRAERIDALMARAAKHWETLAALQQQGRRNILSVTHSGILQWLIKVTFGHSRWMPLVPVRNCSISQFTLDNTLDDETVRHYFQWTFLNHLPLEEDGSSRYLFLDRDKT